jgi:hypothetical protein
MNISMRFFSLIMLVVVIATISDVRAQSCRLIETYRVGDSAQRLYVCTNDLVEEKWDTLGQPLFWKEVMKLSPDSCLINIAATRRILGKESFIKWKSQTEEQKTIYKDSVKRVYGLPDNTAIYVTSGKNHFYDFRHVMPSLTKGINVFVRYQTDPWYAQTILLIESPGKLAYSSVGAYGPFQLMKSVAINHGLRVDKTIDEREDFEKSAMGAASLLRKTCIPEAKRILARHSIGYRESDLWFRLFVLHIYHAGAGNVSGLMTHMNPTRGGQELIRMMWQNEFGGFKNASQNYSQVALASLLTLREIIYGYSDYVYECEVSGCDIY